MELVYFNYLPARMYTVHQMYGWEALRVGCWVSWWLPGKLSGIFDWVNIGNVWLYNSHIDINRHTCLPTYCPTLITSIPNNSTYQPNHLPKVPTYLHTYVNTCIYKYICTKSHALVVPYEVTLNFAKLLGFDIMKILWSCAYKVDTSQYTVVSLSKMFFASTAQCSCDSCKSCCWLLWKISVHPFCCSLGCTKTLPKGLKPSLVGDLPELLLR